jgi:hypothetical protein
MRIWRIELITRIAPSGVKAPLTGPGFLGNCRSGCFKPPTSDYVWDCDSSEHSVQHENHSITIGCCVAHRPAGC